MGIAVLFSGGKDSTYTTYLAQKKGFKIKYLITMLSRNPESYMFHTQNIIMTNLHGKAMGINVIQKETEGIKEKELDDLYNVLNSLEITGIATGAVMSKYQMNRIISICEKLNLDLYAPLWQKNEEELLQEIVRIGFECIFVTISADGFDQSWVGKKIDEHTIEELLTLRKKNNINISGEGGEYETFVLNGPNFIKRIQIEQSDKIWIKDSGYLKIRKATLIKK